MATRPPLTADEVAALWAQPAVSLAEASALTALGRSTLCRRIAAGDLTARKFGGRVFVPTSELRRAIAGDSDDLGGVA